MTRGILGISREKISLSQLMYSGTRNCLIIYGTPGREERVPQTMGSVAGGSDPPNRGGVPDDVWF